MKSAKKLPASIKVLDEQIGSFIQYWGFKRIHGRVWLHLYLSSRPLEVAELIRRLKVSKTLMSFCINELLDYEVIRPVGTGRYGTVYYEANPDITSVIFNVLKKREKKIFAEIQDAFAKVNALTEKDMQEHLISIERVDSLGKMIKSADTVLSSFFVIQDRDRGLESEKEFGPEQFIEFLALLARSK